MISKLDLIVGVIALCFWSFLLMPPIFWMFKFMFENSLSFWIEVFK